MRGQEKARWQMLWLQKSSVFIQCDSGRMFGMDSAAFELRTFCKCLQP